WQLLYVLELRVQHGLRIAVEGHRDVPGWVTGCPSGSDSDGGAPFICAPSRAGGASPITRGEALDVWRSRHCFVAEGGRLCSVESRGWMQPILQSDESIRRISGARV